MILYTSNAFALTWYGVLSLYYSLARPFTAPDDPQLGFTRAPVVRRSLRPFELRVAVGGWAGSSGGNYSSTPQGL